MEILNCNPRPVTTMYDGVLYEFPPFDVLSLTEDAGRHIAHKYKRKGLVAVRYGDDPDQVKLRGLSELARWLRSGLRRHESINALQAEKKFPPLPEDDHVREAQRDLEAIEREIENMRRSMGVDEQKKAQEEIAAAFEKGRGAQMPDLEDCKIEELRRIARDRGVRFNVRWGRKRMRQAIEEQVASVDKQQKASA